MSEISWKNFPKDKPLKSGLYRVEYDCADHHWYQCWYWDEDAWVEENFRGCLIHLHHKTNIRFKPWNDEETVEPKVLLTVEEAKEILQSSYDVLSWADCGYTHTDNALKVQKLLKDRIEQVWGEE